MRIRLTRKLADELDGIDLSPYGAGDVFEAPRYEAELLIAEAWAVAADEPGTVAVGSVSVLERRTVATAQAKRQTSEQLRYVREAMAVQQFEGRPQRRAEDRIRDELHDERAKTITCRSTDRRDN